MSFLTKLSVGGRLRLSFGGLLLVMILVGGVGLFQTAQLSAIASDLTENQMPSIRFLGEIAEATMRTRQLQAAAVLASGPEQKAAITQRRSETERDLQTATQGYQPMIDPGEERALFSAFELAWKDYLSQSKRLDEPGVSEAAAGQIFNIDLQAPFAKARESLRAGIDYNQTMGRLRTAEAQAAFRQTVWAIGGATALGALSAIFAALWLNRNVTARVVRLAGTMRQLASRDYAFELPCATRPDEIGDMARAIDECRTGLKSADALAAEQAQEQLAKSARAARLEELTGGFETKAGEMVGLLASAATELQATAQSMTSTAGLTTERAAMVAQAANQASGNVQTVAVAAEELVASVSEITRQITQTAAASSRAASDAAQTQNTVQALAEAAERIGQVVSLISNIAGQTNLLALNATIEAARAGDAGKGFAVVASEVKALASQTSKATDEISQQVGHIQAATRDAVAAIEAITLTIGEVSQTTAAIAAAVEEQGAATQEIARNIQEASGGTQEVTQNIGEVSQAADGTNASARDVLTAADDLSRQTEVFSGEVTLFLTGVRAA